MTTSSDTSLSEEAKTGKGESSEQDTEALSSEHSSQKTDDSLNLGFAEPEDDGRELPVELPRFRSLHSAREVSNKTVDLAMRRLPDAFTPTRPKFDAKLFAGRHRQFERIVTAIEEDYAHVILFGERGRGKTSLANVVARESAAARYTVLKCTCSSNDTFEKIFRLLLMQIPSRVLDENSLGVRAKEIKVAAELLPEGSFGPTELTDVLRHVTSDRIILLIDEFDRVMSDELKGQLAEAIKNLSDAAARVTLFIVGVAGDVESLIGMHPSIQRNLAVVQMPLMSTRELLALLETAEKRAEITIRTRVKRAIATLAGGLPYYAQLLGLYAARHALQRGVTRVGTRDLRAAIDRAVAESEDQQAAVYDKAVASKTGTLMYDVLFAAAGSVCDRFGKFESGSVGRALGKFDRDDIKLVTVQRALHALTQESRGPILEKCRTPGGVRYRFINQVMRQYIFARQVRERGIFE